MGGEKNLGGWYSRINQSVKKWLKNAYWERLCYLGTGRLLVAAGMGSDWSAGSVGPGTEEEAGSNASEAASPDTHTYTQTRHLQNSQHIYTAGAPSTGRVKNC